MFHTLSYLFQLPRPLSPPSLSAGNLTSTWLGKEKLERERNFNVLLPLHLPLPGVCAQRVHFPPVTTAEPSLLSTVTFQIQAPHPIISYLHRDTLSVCLPSLFHTISFLPSLQDHSHKHTMILQ